jgi:hypothetical protein
VEKKPKKNKHNLYSCVVKKINVLKFPYAVWQSFLSISPHLSGGSMATSQTCCHLPGKMLNSAAECADRARINADLKEPEKYTAEKHIWEIPGFQAVPLNCTPIYF